MQVYYLATFVAAKQLTKAAPRRQVAGFSLLEADFKLADGTVVMAQFWPETGNWVAAKVR